MPLEADNPGLQVARRITSQSKLYSIHGLLNGRVVEGKFEVRDQPYGFSFAPATAAVADHKLVLTGRLTLESPQSVTRFADGVAARLVAVQGGVGSSQPRRQFTAQTSQTATSDQKLEQEKGPETDLQPGLHPFENPRLDESGRPTVDATGPLSFTGVLYFSLSPLDGSALGVRLDLSKLQLNLRLAPTDDLARDLHSIFSDVADSLYGEPRDERTATAQVRELNRMLKS